MTVVETSAGDGITLLLLNRPHVLNAIDEAMVDALERALDRAEDAANVRAVVLTGAGRAFCVGSDLKERGCDPEARIMRMHRLILRLVQFPKLVVAAFNGLGLGGGLELGLACALRIAAPGARLGLPEIHHALMPAYGATQLLPKLVGTGQALQLMLFGEIIDVAHAQAIGLVDAVEEDPVAAAVALVARCPSGSTLAQLEIRRAVMDGLGLPLARGLAIERSSAMRVAASKEAQTAVARFAEGSA